MQIEFIEKKVLFRGSTLYEDLICRLVPAKQVPLCVTGFEQIETVSPCFKRKQECTLGRGWHNLRSFLGFGRARP